MGFTTITLYHLDPFWKKHLKQMRCAICAFLVFRAKDSNKVKVYQWTIGCNPNSVSMVFVVFSRDSWDYNP